MNINLRAIFANDKHMGTYFGITSAQSSSSGLEEFKASSGIKDVSGGASFMYLFDKHWSIITFANYSRLLDESPLVKHVGSKNQFLLMFGTAYRF